MNKLTKKIVDTTLRDGEQSAGLAFRVEDKIMIAGWLDAMKIDQIEAGIPALGSSEIEAVTRIAENKSHSVISTWNRLNVKDIEISARCCPDIIHISAPVSYAQLYVKLRKNKNWLTNQIQACVTKAQDLGFDVTVGFEDASRADICFMVTLAEMLKKMQVRTIRIADTVGVLHPAKTEDMVSMLIKETGIDIEFHSHNDLGMAVANSIAACKAGAIAADCTISGIGERAGNCNLQHFLLAAAASFDLPVSSEQAKWLEDNITVFMPEGNYESNLQS